jgi:GNAT superfamily N-acetyltransferase
MKLRGKRVTVRGESPADLVIEDAGGRAVGTLRASLRQDEAWIDDVTIDAAMRGFGLGGEAVRLFEAWAEKQGAMRFRAGVHEANGLGVYFLLRLGYRPSEVGQAGRTFAMMREAG